MGGGFVSTTFFLYLCAMNLKDKCDVCGSEDIVQHLTTIPSQMEMNRYETYVIGRCEKHKISSLAYETEFMIMNNQVNKTENGN
jgi:hypothetical protein